MVPILFSKFKMVETEITFIDVGSCENLFNRLQQYIGIARAIKSRCGISRVGIFTALMRKWLSEKDLFQKSYQKVPT